MHFGRELLTAGWSKGPHKAKSEGEEAGEPIAGSKLFLESRFLSCFASSSLLVSPFRAWARAATGTDADDAMMARSALSPSDGAAPQSAQRPPHSRCYLYLESVSVSAARGPRTRHQNCQPSTPCGHAIQAMHSLD